MNLDEMLSQPLPDVPDNGFSVRVIARVRQAERRRAAVIAFVSITVTTILCLLLPLHHITGEIAVAMVQIGTSPLVALAGALLVLTFFIDRLFSDRRLLQF